MSVIQFSLNGAQLKKVRKHGLNPAVAGPVEGTRDMCHLELDLSDAAKLLTVGYRWGKEDCKEMGQCRVITMWPPTHRKSA